MIVCIHVYLFAQRSIYLSVPPPTGRPARCPIDRQTDSVKLEVLLTFRKKMPLLHIIIKNSIDMNFIYLASVTIIQSL